MEEQDDPPKVLEERPELFPDLYPVWDAFWYLHSTRSSGMSIGGILTSEIISYWRDLIGITDQAEVAEKANYIRKMDDEYLRIIRAKEN